MYRVQIHNSLQYGVKVHMLYRCKLSKLTRIKGYLENA